MDAFLQSSVGVSFLTIDACLVDKDQVHLFVGDYKRAQNQILGLK
jgi:hypothetical protein